MCFCNSAHYLWIWQNHKKIYDEHVEIPGFFMILKAVVIDFLSECPNIEFQIVCLEQFGSYLEEPFLIFIL